MKYKAVLFDVDGTLLDTREFIFQGFDYTFDLHNLPRIDRNILSQSMGNSLTLSYQNFFPNTPIEHLVEAHRVFQEHNLHLAVPFEHTLTTLALIKERGIKLAAVTTRSSRTSIDTLKNTGVYQYLDVVISGDDVENRKPHPEPVFKALELLKIEPHEAVMIGDTDSDILAGKSAGTQTIGVSYGFFGETIRDHGPDYVVTDIKEVIEFI
ncbi:MAG TPA: HAD-IA family hydrolase [Candidatus Magasanikbacteria bacterium]|nr:HAD-IA family hydrolase [Candidatus Magasanikbacteria bacterium]